MNITLENTGELTAMLKVEVSPEDYGEKYSKVLKDYQRKANIPGFRPGKVPVGVIKKMYGQAVLAEEVNKVASDAIYDYLSNNNIQILGNPIPNREKTPQPEFNEGNSFEFFFDLGMRPEVNASVSDKVKVNSYTIKVDDKLVDKYLDDLRKRFGKYSKPETAEEGDVIYGEFAELDKDGNVLEGGIQYQSPIMPEYIKLETVKKKLNGIKIEESVVLNPAKAIKDTAEIAAMLNISREEAENLKSDFRFTVTSINRVEPAELNDEFFSKVYRGEEIKSEEQLRERIRKDAEETSQSQSERHFLTDSMKILVKNADIKLPDEFLKNWILNSNEDKITPEQVAVQYDSYADTLRQQMVEGKIMSDFDIKIEEEDIKEYVRNYFRNPAQPQDSEADKRIEDLVNMVMQNQEETKKIYEKLLEERLIAVLKSELKVVKKEVSYEEFIKLATENK